MATDRQIQQLLHDLQVSEKLPDSWRTDAAQWFPDLAAELAQRRARQGRTLCAGISGAQGTGKSTLAQTLMRLLTDIHGLNTVALSLDDFYLSRAERHLLAATVHPLLQTRGVPGTHNIEVALRTIRQLKAGQQTALPKFDKAADDTVSTNRWLCQSAPADIIIFEGWCVGLAPQSSEELATAVNALEQNEDPDGGWRRFVNQQLADGYQSLFAEMDYLVMLKAPGFEQIYQWRNLQEQKLYEVMRNDNQSSNPQSKNATRHLMSEHEVRRFIAHYERLTRHALYTLPKMADVVFDLDEQHRIVGRQHGGTTTSCAQP